VLLPLVTAAFVADGPLQPGWARQAGTPPPQPTAAAPAAPAADGLAPGWRQLRPEARW
jgi:hypothetical protein